MSVTTSSFTDTPVTVYPLIVKSDVATVAELMFAENVTAMVVSEVALDDVMVICFSVLRLSASERDSESESEIDAIAFTASDSDSDSESEID